MHLPLKNSSQVEKLIPQKPPFVMVDALLDFDDNSSVSSLKISDDNVLVFDGKFSEAGILEHQAQSIALHGGYKTVRENSEPRKGYIAMIKAAEIFFLPKTGDEITSKVEILSETAGMSSVKITSQCAGKPFAETEMKTVLMGNDSF